MEFLTEYWGHIILISFLIIYLFCVYYEPKEKKLDKIEPKIDTSHEEVMKILENCVDPNDSREVMMEKIRILKKYRNDMYDILSDISKKLKD